MVSRSGGAEGVCTCPPPTCIEERRRKWRREAEVKLGSRNGNGSRGCHALKPPGARQCGALQVWGLEMKPGPAEKAKPRCGRDPGPRAGQG